jgi:hypothetical protein
MKKGLFLFAILAAFAFAPQSSREKDSPGVETKPPPSCNDFHNGSFKMYDERIGNYYIKRQGSVQIEYSDKTKLRLETKIKWIDDCTFELRMHKVLENPNNIDMVPPLKLTNKIIEVKEKSYVVQTVAEGYDFVLTQEYFVDE